MSDMDGKIRALVVEPGEKPYEKAISNTLEELQKWVNGYIEVVYPFEDPVGIICNEEAKLDGLELNRGLYDGEGNMYDIIAGRFLVVGLTEDDFGSLTDEQMIKYKEMYKEPQAFLVIDGQLRSFDVHTAQKAFFLADRMVDLSLDSGLMAYQVGDQWNEMTWGQQGGIIQQKEELYLNALLTGRNHVLRADLEEIENRFLDFKDDKDALEDRIDAFLLEREMGINPLKNTEEMIEDDYGMIDGILNNGKKQESIEL